MRQILVCLFTAAAIAFLPPKLVAIPPPPAIGYQLPNTSAAPSASQVPTWSLNYAMGVGKPHNSFAIVDHTLKAKSDLFGFPKLSAMAVAFAGTQLGTSSSTSPAGLTAGFGGQLAYQLGGNLFVSGGLGFAEAAGQRGAHEFWLLGASLKF